MSNVNVVNDDDNDGIMNMKGWDGRMRRWIYARFLIDELIESILILYTCWFRIRYIYVIRCITILITDFISIYSWNILINWQIANSFDFDRMFKMFFVLNLI